MVKYQRVFQDPATINMSGIHNFDTDLFTSISFILFSLSWTSQITTELFLEYVNKTRNRFFHSEVIEIIWTSGPAGSLVSLSHPSISLLGLFHLFTSITFWLGMIKFKKRQALAYLGLVVGTLVWG